MSSTSSPFGQNEWLVEEMYRRFRDDPSSVDTSWHDFLVDYNPDPVEPPTDGSVFICCSQPRDDIVLDL